MKTAATIKNSKKRKQKQHTCNLYPAVMAHNPKALQNQPKAGHNAQQTTKAPRMHPQQKKQQQQSTTKFLQQQQAQLIIRSLYSHQYDRGQCLSQWPSTLRTAIHQLLNNSSNHQLRMHFRRRPQNALYGEIHLLHHKLSKVGTHRTQKENGKMVLAGPCINHSLSRQMSWYIISNFFVLWMKEENGGYYKLEKIVTI